MYDFQKANMWKRISAALCDMIALGIVAVGIAFLLSAILGYDGQAERLEQISESYETQYGVDFDVSGEDYEKLSEADKAQYELAMDSFAKDEEANRVYNTVVNLSFIIVTFGILIAFVILELVVPLLFGNGQTLGKKVFGVAVMREDGVKLTSVLLFTRAILGKYTVETMLPVFIVLSVYWGLMGIVGTVVLIGLLILQIILLVTTKERKVLHDMLAHTVTVDFASQMIFDTPEAMLEYKKRIHAEQVNSETN